MNRNEKTLESISLGINYDQEASFAKTKNGVAIYFLDCAVFIGNSGICIQEDEDKIYLNNSQSEFVSRLLNYRKNGGRTNIKNLQKKYENS